MIFYDNFVKLCCFYDFRPPISNFMTFYDFMLTGTPVNNWLCQCFSLCQKFLQCRITINLSNDLNRQKLKNIAIIFTLTIKMLCSPTSIFAGLNIAFMYSKAIFEISSRTNVLLKTVLTGKKDLIFNIFASIIYNFLVLISLESLWIV